MVEPDVVFSIRPPIPIIPFCHLCKYTRFVADAILAICPDVFTCIYWLVFTTNTTANENEHRTRQTKQKNKKEERNPPKNSFSTKPQTVVLVVDRGGVCRSQRKGRDCWAKARLHLRTLVALSNASTNAVWSTIWNGGMCRLWFLAAQLFFFLYFFCYQCLGAFFVSLPRRPASGGGCNEREIPNVWRVIDIYYLVLLWMVLAFLFFWLSSERFGILTINNVFIGENKIRLMKIDAMNQLGRMAFLFIAWLWNILIFDDKN